MWYMGSWECHQCRQALHTWWWKSLSPTPTCDHWYCTQLLCVPLFRNNLITNQPTTNPIASLICENKSSYLIIDQPTTQPINIFALVILLIRYLHRAYYFNTGLMSPHQEYVWIIEGNKIYIWQQHGSCGTQGEVYIYTRYVYMMGCAYLYRVHVVLQ